ncbi:hypothetical protein [Bradyrhizobium guangzhouense]|uniref:Uncharacterized protein n=1 Tax=Bradyrhizobium guangzhouense TaxID=1325095 RepID=A0AAE6CBH7_9BRAD|nr:hypothetical protein [Bradyrhizobium guangzhouense]QAU49662.1 hypothetical protein XH91_32725 [Bradyrhizobium guangzhouense]
MTDHTQHLKSTYWEIKYREWRPVILLLPFAAFFVGALFSWLLFPRTITVETPIEKIVTLTKEIPATITQPADDRKINTTYKDASCDGKQTDIKLPARTAFTFPTRCRITVGFLTKADSHKVVLLYDTAAPKGSHILLPDGQTISVNATGELIIDSLDQDIVMVFNTSPR